MSENQSAVPKKFGGRQENAGRKKGSANKLTKQSLRIAAGVKLRGKEIPLEYMLRVMNDETADNSRRDYMAVAAAPYCHTKQHAVAIDKTSVSVSIDGHNMTLQEIQAAYREFRSRPVQLIEDDLKMLANHSAALEQAEDEDAAALVIEHDEDEDA